MTYQPPPELEVKLNTIHGLLAAVAGELVLVLVSRRGLTASKIYEWNRRLRHAADELSALPLHRRKP